MNPAVMNFEIIHHKCYGCKGNLSSFYANLIRFSWVNENYRFSLKDELTDCLMEGGKCGTISQTVDIHPYTQKCK